VTKQEFRILFDDALEVAADNAAERIRRPLPRNFEIEMHGLADHSRLLTTDQAFELLYLGQDRFYRIIDISVIAVGKDV
jgi:hypothetical protein